MDKKEYQDKLNEINQLIALEDYQKAAQVADSIDWKRVRNVQTLMMVSEIYEAVNRYEDSKVLLLRAYRRSPLGRTVLYRLVEVTIRLGQFDEAIEYYSEYVQAAPHDNNKYILKYKIYRGRGSSLDEQIAILKEYLDQEYDDKWAYELAKLQVQADRVQDAISTCDDLVLWFQSGKYVIKALELKRRYAPLTRKQQEIYDSRFDQADAAEEEDGEEGSYLKQAASVARAAAQKKTIQTELANDISKKKPETAQAETEVTSAEESTAAPDSAAKTQEASAAAAADEAIQADAAASASAGVNTEAASGDAAQTSVAAPAAESASDSAEISEEETPAENTAGTFEKMQEAIRASVEEIPDAVPEVAEPAEEPEEEIDFDQEQLQKEALRSMREIVAGVGPRDSVDEEEARIDEIIDQSKADQEEAVAARGVGMTFQVPSSEASQKRNEAAKLTIDDILLSMGESGQRVREAAAKAEGVLTADEERKANDQAHGFVTYGAGNMTGSADVADEVRAAAASIEESVSDQTQMAAEDAVAEAKELAAAAVAQPARNTEELPVSGIEESAEEPIANLPKIPHVEYTKEVAEAKTKKLPTEEIRRIHEALLAHSAAAEEEVKFSKGAEAAGLTADISGAVSAAEPVAQAAGIPAAEPVVKAAEDTAAHTAANLDEDIRIAVTPGAAKAEETVSVAAETVTQTSESVKTETESVKADVTAGADEASAGKTAAAEDMPAAETPAEPEETVAAEEISAEVTSDVPEAVTPEGEAPAEAEEIPAEETPTVQEIPAEETPAVPEDTAADETPDAAGPADAGETAQAQAVADEVEIRSDDDVQAAAQAEYYGSKPKLKEYQKDLFRGFLGIGSLEEQIANAITQAQSKQGDRTSRTGNVLILGAHGCGKTTIATGIAKAIAEDQGSHTVKMARIYAADLNRKDIAATIAKIAGGVLIIEEAGDLEDAVVDQLTTAMEFRTDGLIVILEDEQRYIHDLLMRHPRFTMKFTAQIYIPQYSNEDLVNFCQIYAQSKDYVISEQAAAALYDRIESVSQSGENVSITNGVELVDRAIHNANKFFRRLQSAKKRFDSMDRVILQEKDFK